MVPIVDFSLHPLYLEAVLLQCDPPTPSIRMASAFSETEAPLLILTAWSCSHQFLIWSLSISISNHSPGRFFVGSPYIVLSWPECGEFLFTCCVLGCTLALVTFLVAVVMYLAEPIKVPQASQSIVAGEDMGAGGVVAAPHILVGWEAEIAETKAKLTTVLESHC